MTREATVVPRMEGLASIRARVHEELERRSIASLAVSVTRHGELLWQECFGWADRQERRPATPDTPYLLGSISKIITATGVAVLVSRSEVDLDRPINDYLGDDAITPFVGDPNALTVRNVLRHMAGFPDHCSFVFEDEPALPLAPSESIRRFGNVVYPPGTFFFYSNFGYGLLGHMIARVSGLTLHAFLERHVFAPLQMRDSFVDWDEARRPLMARGHGTDGQRLPLFHAELPAASAFYASVSDLTRFSLFHLGVTSGDQTPLFDANLRRLMQTPSVQIHRGRDLGLGWILISSPEYPGGIVNHDGRTCGCTTRIWLLPHYGVSVCVLCNSRDPYPWHLANEIGWHLAHGSQSKQSAPAHFFPSERKPERPMSLEPIRGRWLGHVHTFERRIDVRLEVSGEGGVSIQLGNAAWAPLERLGFDGRQLTGKFQGDLRLSDDRRHPPAEHLTCHLLRSEERLAGQLCVSFPSGTRSGDDYGFFMQLERRAGD